MSTAPACASNPDASAPAPNDVLVEVRRAAFGYGGRPVVRVDALRLCRGRCLGVFGPNGAGKTTLVRGVTGLLPPLAGEVVRQPAIPSSSAVLEYARRPPPPLRFGYLPQHRAMDPNWPMSGFDAAALAVSARRPLGRLTRDDRGRVRAALRRLDVEPLAARPFARLSGGQQQRLLLAGAVAADPQALVLDEPTDGLDVRSRRVLLDLLKQLTADGLCTVVISHAVEDLLFLCDEVAWLHAAGAEGEPSHVELIPPAGLAERVLAAPGRHEG